MLSYLKFIQTGIGSQKSISVISSFIVQQSVILAVQLDVLDGTSGILFKDINSLKETTFENNVTEPI